MRVGSKRHACDLHGSQDNGVYTYTYRAHAVREKRTHGVSYNSNIAFPSQETYSNKSSYSGFPEFFSTPVSFLSKVPS